MRLNPFILPMIKRTKIQSGLKGPKSPLHFQELLVPKAIYSGQRLLLLVKIFPIQSLFGFHLGPIDFERSVFELPQIPPQCPMGQKSADGFLKDFPLVAQDLESFFLEVIEMKRTSQLNAIA
jgi:hypothetical protein